MEECDGSAITSGTAVTVTDVTGTPYHAQATSGVVTGGVFPIVWVTFTAGDHPIPWPLEAVTLR